MVYSMHYSYRRHCCMLLTCVIKKASSEAVDDPASYWRLNSEQLGCFLCSFDKGCPCILILVYGKSSSVWFNSQKKT